MEFTALLEEFCAAVEAGDGARLAALFTPDGIYHDTFYGENTGHEAIAAMLEERFHGDGERYLWEMENPVCDGRIGYATWIFSYTSTMPGSRGTRVVFRGIGRFELEGGLIRRYTEQFDSGRALVQLGFPPERLMKLFDRWNGEFLKDPALRRHLEG